MTMLGKCDVCGINNPVGVCSSTFGAVSLAYCHFCLHKPAEAEWIFHYLWCDVANGKPETLTPEIKGWYTFKDGEYITWDEWCEKVGKHIDLEEHNRQIQEALRGET